MERKTNYFPGCIWTRYYTKFNIFTKKFTCLIFNFMTSLFDLKALLQGGYQILDSECSNTILRTFFKTSISNTEIIIIILKLNLLQTWTEWCCRLSPFSVACTVACWWGNEYWVSHAENSPLPRLPHYLTNHKTIFWTK